jgi:PAS domain S-box-containing protein
VLFFLEPIEHRRGIEVVGLPWSNNADATLAGLQKSFAVIEFEPNGTIITANPLFCEAMGYTLAEIRGRKHSLFVDPGEVGAQAYADFWTRLGSGAFDSGEYKRIGKEGREVWLQASYSPVLALMAGWPRWSSWPSSSPRPSSSRPRTPVSCRPSSARRRSSNST